jgi:hypothetical protein
VIRNKHPTSNIQHPTSNIPTFSIRLMNNSDHITYTPPAKITNKKFERWKGCVQISLADEVCD